MWYVDLMGIRRYAPDWVDIEPTRLDDGRQAALIRVPESDNDLLELVLDLPALGALAAHIDEIRTSALAL